MKLPNLIYLLAFALALPCSAHADGTEHRDNVVNFSVDVVKQLPNDVLTASFYVEETDSNPVKLADHINKTINAALAKGHDKDGVKLRSGGQQTWPVYSTSLTSSTKQHLDGWRTRAYVQLEARNFAAAQLLIADLQDGMNLDGLNFSVAPETRRLAENGLVGEALAAFRERADLVRQGLGGKNYKIVNIQISNNGEVSPQPRYLMKSMAASSMAPVAQNLAAGDSSITMQVSGDIQIEP